MFGLLKRRINSFLILRREGNSRPSNLGNLVRTWRHYNSISKQELARRIGISWVSLTNLEETGYVTSTRDFSRLLRWLHSEPHPNPPSF